MIQKKYNIKPRKYSAKIKDNAEDEFDDNFDDTFIVDEEEEDDEDEIDVSLSDDEDIENMLGIDNKTYIITPVVTEVIENKMPAAPKKRGPKPNQIQFYVEPKEFDEKIGDFYKTEHISNDLASMINKIAHKLSYAPNFINYTYRDEMVGDAIVRMMKALISKKYTHAKGKNPFSYFTKIAFNAFRNRIKKEKYMHDTLQKYQEEVIMSSEYNNFIKNKKKYNSEDTSSLQEE